MADSTPVTGLPSPPGAVPAASAPAVDVSVVVPVLNEEGSVAELARRIAEVLAATPWTWELVFIDDGSSDATPQVLAGLAAAAPGVRVLTLQRNFGKAAALTAGFDAAQGRYVVTMDADLQDDPAEIPRFVAMLKAGADVVSGWKKVRNDPLDKTLPSKLFNWVTRRVSGVQLNDFNCGFKGYRARTLEHLNLYGELHRFIPVILHWQGFRVGELAVQHHPRRHGRSKYGVSRLFKGFFDLLTVVLLTRYRARPLHLFGYLGTAAGALGGLILAYLAVLWLLGYGPIGTRPLLIFGLLLVVVGVQFFCTGLVAELIRETTTRRQPPYVVRPPEETGDAFIQVPPGPVPPGPVPPGPVPPGPVPPDHDPPPHSD
ncbi:MAG: glycosyltransferase family 2 protein [Rhodospirillaceae bacterium]|nr:glycosyltransferase family 2 protein [Rhodospirillaceae bacterium]